MKTFKQLIAEVAQPNNDDELNFKEKHTIEVIDYSSPDDDTSAKPKRSPRRRADYEEGDDVVVYEASKLDPIGKADADIDNDGDTDSSDEYLHARRKAIAKAMKEAAEKKLDPIGKADADIDNDGDTDNSDEYLHARRKAIATAMKKESVSLKEKAVSQDQQQAAGVALAVKRGEKPKSALIGASKEMYKMSEKDLEDFARTKHKGLPVKIQEASDSKIIASINAGDSIDVTVQKNLNRKGDNKDEILKVIRDYNWKKRMKKEEVGQIDEDATLDKIRDILTKKNDGTKVVKDKSGYFHIKTANSHKGPFHTMKDVLKDLDESAFVAKAAVAHTDGKKKFKLGDEEFPVTIKPSNAKKIVNQIDEVSYSAKAAVSGKDIGKPGKEFEKIAKSAAERYGSEESGKKVAGAVLAKLRAKNETKVPAAKSSKLDEALPSDIVRGDGYAGVPDGIVMQAKDRVKKMKPETASDHTKAMYKALADLGWEKTMEGKWVRESFEITEAFKSGVIKLNDGSSIIIKEQDAKILNQLVDELTATNRDAMMSAAMKNKKGFNEILGFAKEAL